MPKCSVSDLEWACLQLVEFEYDGDTEKSERAIRVCNWLNQEIDHRKRASDIAKAAKVNKRSKANPKQEYCSLNPT